jgi:hypothetical protein
MKTLPMFRRHCGTSVLLTGPLVSDSSLQLKNLRRGGTANAFPEGGWHKSNPPKKTVTSEKERCYAERKNQLTRHSRALSVAPRDMPTDS